MTDPKHTNTSRSGDLVAAMKDQIESWEFEDPRETWWKWQHQYAQAADRIEALEAENERLRGKVSQAILYLDDVAGLTENPLYNPLEVGFRHSPLSPKEREERYATACSAAWQSAQHGLAALGEKQ